jgi:nucleoside-diphosphate-sugar epimerase
LDQGDEVVCVDHFRSHSVDTFTDPRTTTVPTDVRDLEKVAQAMVGVDRVFHLAASVSTKSLEHSRSINVDGTVNLATAAAAQPTPPVFLFVSSLAAAGPNPRPSREIDSCHPVSHYGRTKLEAERQLFLMADQLPITIVRPPCVIGPGDRNLLALYKTVIKSWNFVLSRTAKYSYLSVNDLVIGMLAAVGGNRLRGLEDQEKRGVYYLTDPVPLSFPELAEMIAETLGKRRVRHFKVPKFVGWGVGGFGELTMRLGGAKSYLNFDKIREGLAGDFVCDGTRALKELGFKPAADLMQRISETTEHYQECNLI